jgi:hypothetical protein
MKLGARKGGTSTSFVDTNADEILLQFSWNAAGGSYFAYRIYDGTGVLVAESDGVRPIRAVSITGLGDEMLLEVPEDIEQHVRYRLYNSQGRLLTSSDGTRTQIFGLLRMEPNRAWPSPAPEKTPDQ